MKTIEPPATFFAERPTTPTVLHRGDAFDPGAVHAFDQVMNGFTAAVAPAVQGPSLVSQMVRVPAQAYAEGMADIQKPRPEGMSVMDSFEFYARKQIDLNELKILNNLSTTVVRMVRKDVETVLNSK
ncbi:hypothetical protein GN316_15610 [Xylophilus sp. Kf1]|nr:hypothetical protein [Xylophilus sp. Kf1]